MTGGKYSIPNYSQVISLYTFKKIITNYIFRSKWPGKSLHSSLFRRRVTNKPLPPPSSKINIPQLTNQNDRVYITIGEIDEVLGNETANSLEGSESPSPNLLDRSH